MVQFGQIPGNVYNAMNATATNAGAAIHGTFTQKNAQTGRSEWNGKNVSIAVATGTAALAAGIVVRYGADSSAILKGIQNDSGAALGAVKGGFDYTVGGVFSGASKTYAVFTGALSSTYEFIKPMPGQVAQGFQSLGTQIKDGFDSVGNQLSEISNRLRGIEDKLGVNQ